MKEKLLIWKLNHGSEDALCQIYEKYRDNMVRIAAGLLNDVGTSEDVVQDVFLTFVHSAGKSLTSAGLSFVKPRYTKDCGNDDPEAMSVWVMRSSSK